MSNGKLDPRSLTSEERVVVEEMVTRTGTDSGYVFTGDNAQFVGWHVEVEYAEAYAAAFQRILARRAIFGETESETVDTLEEQIAYARKMEGKPASEGGRAETDHSGYYFASCEQPAQPEPVAVEMPAPILRAMGRLAYCASSPHETDKWTEETLAIRTALESFWRTHAAQPAKVRMTEELERVLKAAEMMGDYLSIFPRNVNPGEPNGKEIRKAIAAVRAQAAEAGKVPLPKARKMLEYMRRCAWHEATYQQIEEGLAELDAAEGRK